MSQGNMPSPHSARVVVDQTHLNRHVTGIERIALELFSPAALFPHHVELVKARSMPGMLAAQQFEFIRRGLFDRNTRIIFSGFPPTPLSCLLGDQCLMYVHDTFPITRREDLGWKALAYTAPIFGWAIKRLRNFFVNSFATGRSLRQLCRGDALIALLRPVVRDVFGVRTVERGPRSEGYPIRLLMIGTIEPRKDYPKAFEIVSTLNAMGIPTELDLVGRVGWGDHSWLTNPPDFLRLHGYVDDLELRRIISRADLFLSTSKAEGLGLPQLEVQHGGLPVVAPQGEVSEESLGSSALLIDPADSFGAAAQIRGLMEDRARLSAIQKASVANVTRWNALAQDDHDRFRQFLSDGPSVYQSRSFTTVD
jgi:glycosyltransferase involved in cell wall biosynthesis